MRSEYSRRLGTQPCGESVLSVMVEDEVLLNLTDCGLFLMKSMTQLQSDGFSHNRSSLLTKVCRMIIVCVLKQT